MALKKFHLDRTNGKFMGVCAGLGRYFNVDPNFIRIGAVVVTLLGAFPWTLIAYGVAAWLGKPKAHGLFEDEARPGAKFSTKDLHLNTRDIDRRMAEVESYVTNSNNSLASEIERLR